MSIKPSAGSYVERNSGFFPYNNFSLGIWIYLRDRAGDAILFKQEASGGTIYDTFKVTTAGVLQIDTSIASQTGSNVIPLITWTHIGIKRIGNARTMYINNVSEVSASDVQVYTKAVENVGGRYLATTTADYIFAACKGWTGDVGSFEPEMYGYDAVATSGLHTVTKFLTATDVDNTVSTGVDWSVYGTLTTDNSAPNFLSSGSGGVVLRRRRRQNFGGV